MADKPCDTCVNYDPIIRGKDSTGRHGRCVPRSTYPHAEQAGQSFPPGCKRAEPGELAKPAIVVGSEIVRSCELYRGKP